MKSGFHSVMRLICLAVLLPLYWVDQSVRFLFFAGSMFLAFTMFFSVVGTLGYIGLSQYFDWKPMEFYPFKPAWVTMSSVTTVCFLYSHYAFNSAVSHQSLRQGPAMAGGSVRL
jgi:hypothetical protein